MNIQSAFFIYQHMGLGYHLICNGLIRKLIRPDQQYWMFVKPHNIGSVAYMYRDISNLGFIKCDDASAISFINHNQVADRLYLIGFRWVDMSRSFEDNFYLQHKVSINEKWDSFRCDRDVELETTIYDHYNIREPYIFVHDDYRYKLDETRFPKGMRIIRPEIGLVDNIFAYATVMERANQIHCMESCFGFMADNMGLNKELFMHRYCRNPPQFEIPLYRNVKEILT